MLKKSYSAFFSSDFFLQQEDLEASALQAFFSSFLQQDLADEHSFFFFPLSSPPKVDADIAPTIPIRATVKNNFFIIVSLLRLIKFNNSF